MQSFYCVRRSIIEGLAIISGESILRLRWCRISVDTSLFTVGLVNDDIIIELVYYDNVLRKARWTIGVWSYHEGFCLYILSFNLFGQDNSRLNLCYKSSMAIWCHPFLGEDNPPWFIPYCHPCHFRRHHLSMFNGHMQCWSTLTHLTIQHTYIVYGDMKMVPTKSVKS